MVRGRGIAVTAVALMYQWADTTRMARGRGTACPKARHALEYRLISIAFIGFPCPKNAAGITAGVSLVTLMPASQPEGTGRSTVLRPDPAASGHRGRPGSSRLSRLETADAGARRYGHGAGWADPGHGRRPRNGRRPR